MLSLWEDSGRIFIIVSSDRDQWRGIGALFVRYNIWVGLVKDPRNGHFHVEKLRPMEDHVEIDS